MNSNKQEFIFDLDPLFHRNGDIEIKEGKLVVSLPVTYNNDLFSVISNKLSKESEPLTEIQIQTLVDDFALEITRCKIFNLLFQNKPGMK